MVVSMSNATKRKVTLYVDEDVLRAARVRAARTDKRDSEVVEDALRSYLGFEAVERVWARSTLSEDERDGAGGRGDARRPGRTACRARFLTPTSSSRP